MMKRFSAEQLKDYLANSDQPPLLLDVREPWEFERCHIAGSKLIPMREIPQAMDGLDPEQEIVLICHHGIRSRQVGLFLESRGFSRLINLDGGVEDWARQVEPGMPRY